MVGYIAKIAGTGILNLVFPELYESVSLLNQVLLLHSRFWLMALLLPKPEPRSHPSLLSFWIKFHSGQLPSHVHKFYHFNSSCGSPSPSPCSYSLPWTLPVLTCTVTLLSQMVSARWLLSIPFSSLLSVIFLKCRSELG